MYLIFLYFILFGFDEGFGFTSAAAFTSHWFCWSVNRRIKGNFLFWWRSSGRVEKGERKTSRARHRGRNISRWSRIKQDDSCFEVTALNEFKALFDDERERLCKIYIIPSIILSRKFIIFSFSSPAAIVGWVQKCSSERVEYWFDNWQIIKAQPTN